MGSLPATPRVSVIPDSTEASPPTLKERRAAETLVQQMGRQSVDEAMRPLRTVEVSEVAEYHHHGPGPARPVSWRHSASADPLATTAPYSN